MEDKEISLNIFEKNAQIYNKKNLKRYFTSISEHYTEYGIVVPPLGCRGDINIRVVIDKEYVTDFIDFIKRRNFKVFGSIDYSYIENVILDYDNKKEYFKEDIAKEFEERLQKINQELKPFNEIENDDCEFYFSPYNDVISNLYEFYLAYKDEILSYAKKNDITIMFNFVAFNNQANGFMAFNFFDADAEEDIVIDTSMRINIYFDLKKLYEVYSASLILAKIGQSEDELNYMNTHIFGDNLRYKGE